MPDEDKKSDADVSEAAESNTDSSTLPDIEANVEAKMEEIRLKSEIDDVDDTSIDTDADTETDVKDDSDTTDDEQDETTDGKSEETLLPSGHRRAALGNGWTNDEVDHYLQINPEDAQARFAELFEKRQEENARWSTRGRELLEADKSKTDESKDDTSIPTKLEHYDIDALVSEHGNDELVRALATPLNTMIDKLNVASDRLAGSEEFLKVTEQNVVVDATQEFLKREDMKTYRDTYGLEIGNLTDEQEKSRFGLFKQADILVAGAKDLGEDITIQDALEGAHTILSRESVLTAARQTVRDSMKKRTKTTKSSHKQTASPDSGQPVSEEELEKRTVARLQELRNK